MKPQDQVRAAQLLGVCIDCGSPTRPRSNWPAIAPAHRAQQASFFHRCSRCYTRRQLDAHQGGKLVRLRRPDTCASCAAAMAKGEAAHVFSRPRGWRMLERVRVCLTCVRLWQRGGADRGMTSKGGQNR